MHRAAAAARGGKRRRVPTPAGDYDGTVRAIAGLVTAARAELALPLPAGRWALAIEPKDAALRPFAAGHDGGEILVESEREVTLVLERSTGPAGPVRARHVVLTRVR